MDSAASRWRACIPGRGCLNSGAVAVDDTGWTPESQLWPSSATSRFIPDGTLLSAVPSELKQRKAFIRRVIGPDAGCDCVSKEEEGSGSLLL